MQNIATLRLDLRVDELGTFLVDSGQIENKFIDEQLNFLGAKINRVMIEQTLLNLADLAIFTEAQFTHFDDDIISHIAMSRDQFRQFLRVPRPKVTMLFAVQGEMARFKRADPQGFDRAGRGFPHLKELPINRTGLLLGFESEQRDFVKELRGCALCVELLLIKIQQRGQRGVFFKSCSAKNRAMASGVAITCFLATACESSTKEACGCLINSTNT